MNEVTRQEIDRLEVAYEAELRARDDAEALKAHWEDFTESRPVPDGFEDRMELAGLVEFRNVTRDDFKQSDAEDRGCWSLTAAGEAVLSTQPSR